MARALWFEFALVDGVWREAVAIVIDAAGVIVSVEPEAAKTGCDVVAGIAMPGMPNLHSHGFQRAMAGLAERGARAGEDFWSWRHVMYRVANELDADEIEAVTAMAYVDMLEAGFTIVGEFHYLHHDRDGSAYGAPGELAGRIMAAAQTSGIGLTLLPCLYSAGGIGRAAEAGQRRFINDIDRFSRLHEEIGVAMRREMANAVLGVAPHSLRAARPEDVVGIAGRFPNGPVHIHAAEQIAEVEECVAALGARPVEWLLANGLDERWCLIHATHMTCNETQALAKSGAVAGLCPLTEADLGDGVFDGANYLSHDGRFGIGSDSLIRVDAAGELRQFDSTQRLRDRQRVVLSPGGSAGDVLYCGALRGGAQALGQKAGILAPGMRADIVVLDRDGSDLAALPPKFWLDQFMFVGGTKLIARVYAGGNLVVEAGRHVARAAVAARFRAVLRRLAATL